MATRSKRPGDIKLAGQADQIAITPDGKTAFVTYQQSAPPKSGSGLVATIDIATGTKRGKDIKVGQDPAGIAVTPDSKTAFVANSASESDISASDFVGTEGRWGSFVDRA